VIWPGSPRKLTTLGYVAGAFLSGYRPPDSRSPGYRRSSRHSARSVHGKSQLRYGKGSAIGLDERGDIEHHMVLALVAPHDELVVEVEDAAEPPAGMAGPLSPRRAVGPVVANWGTRDEGGASVRWQPTHRLLPASQPTPRGRYVSLTPRRRSRKGSETTQARNRSL
jgi:hypothetical protein